MHCFHEVKVMVNKIPYIYLSAKIKILHTDINVDSIRAGQKTTHHPDTNY